MSITKVVSFLSGTEAPATSSRAAQRIRDAAEEPVPLDQLVFQLRQMFTAPHERLCEARFDEMLDILDEQKSAHDDALGALGQRVNSLNAKLEGDYALLSEVFRDALAQSLQELETKIESMSESLRAAIAATDRSLRMEFSSTLAAHVAEDNDQRREDRDHTMNSLEQRIAQWRAEIDDTRRDDMEEVANSMMDIGKRLRDMSKF